MEKLFCDMCEKPASRADTIDLYRSPNPRLKDFDKTAKFRVSINFGYVEHSTGFGGPPDLCRECKIRLIEELIQDKLPT